MRKAGRPNDIENRSRTSASRWNLTCSIADCKSRSSRTASLWLEDPDWLPDNLAAYASLGEGEKRLFHICISGAAWPTR